MTETRFFELFGAVHGVLAAARQRAPRLLAVAARAREAGVDDVAAEIEDFSAWLAVAAGKLASVTASLQDSTVRMHIEDFRDDDANIRAASGDRHDDRDGDVHRARDGGSGVKDG